MKLRERGIYFFLIVCEFVSFFLVGAGGGGGVGRGGSKVPFILFR